MKHKNRRIRWSRSLVAVGGMIVATGSMGVPAFAAVVDLFLKIDGIQGEAVDDKHKGEIEIQSFSWGALQEGRPIHNGGSGAGKVSPQDFHFTLRVGQASAALFLACATGTHMPKAVLTCRKAGGAKQEFLKYTLSDVMVSSYQMSANQDNPEPLNEVQLNFSKVEFEYRPQKPDGSLGPPIRAGWDFKINKAAGVSNDGGAAPGGAVPPGGAAPPFAVPIKKIPDARILIPRVETPR